MKPFLFEDFSENDAWLVTRVDSQVKDQPIDIYLLMELPSGRAIAHEVVEKDVSNAHACRPIDSGDASTKGFP